MQGHSQAVWGFPRNSYARPLLGKQDEPTGMTREGRGLAVGENLLAIQVQARSATRDQSRMVPLSPLPGQV